MILARKAGSLRQPDLLGPWLHRLPIAAALQVKVENSRRKRRETEAAMSGVRPAADAGWQEPGPAVREEIEVLHQEIARLPEKYRSAIVLCDLQGLTHEEALAAVPGRPVGTISADSAGSGVAAGPVESPRHGPPDRRGGCGPENELRAGRAGRAGGFDDPGRDGGFSRADSRDIPASIAITSRGLRSMFLTKLRMMAAATLLAGTAATRRGLLAQQVSSRRPALEVVGPLPQPATVAPAPAAKAETNSVGDPPRETEQIVRSAGNVKRITKGIHAYLDANAHNFLPRRSSAPMARPS